MRRVKWTRRRRGEIERGRGECLIMVKKVRLGGVGEFMKG